MRAWIARDKMEFESNLFLFFGEKPYKYELTDDVWISTNGDFVPLDKELYPEIKWNTEPVEVEVTITIKDKKDEKGD